MHFSLRNLGRLSQIYYHYRRRSIRLPYLPIFAGIETTGLCNLRCVMCPHGQSQYQMYEQGRSHMSLPLFRKVIDEARDFIYDADLFGGGEPLLNPNIFEMIAYAKEAGIHTRIHTNATLLNEERARALLEAGLDFLSFSFEGYSKEYYESTRVNAHYEVVLENIQRFLSLKYSSGKTNPYVVLQVILPPSENRTEEIERGLVTLRAALETQPGLNEFKIIPLHNYGGKVSDLKKGSVVRYTPCTFLWYAIFVLWDGTIVPCCVDWWGEYNLGNLNEITLKEAWHSDKLSELRERIGSQQYQEIPLCSQCDRLWRPQSFGVPFRSLGAMRQWISQHLLGYS